MRHNETPLHFFRFMGYIRVATQEYGSSFHTKTPHIQVAKELILGGIMKTISIEDTWWIDPRRSLLIKLTGDEAIADGLYLRLLKDVQWYGQFRGTGIPKRIFDSHPLNAHLVTAFLAEYVDAFVVDYDTLNGMPI